MDDRKKLIELIEKARKAMNKEEFSCDLARNSFIAEYLIANGVTVQEWISVGERLPEAGEYVVCIAKRNPFSMFMPMVARIKKNGWVNPITEQYISEVTHWMPLPMPQEEGKR